MSSPVWKVYSAAGVYKAACKDGEDAACLAGLHGPGATIKWRHGVIMWREGQEAWSSAEDYSGTAAVLYQRLRDYFKEKEEAYRNAQAQAEMDRRAKQAERDARAEEEERERQEWAEEGS